MSIMMCDAITKRAHHFQLLSSCYSPELQGRVAKIANMQTLELLYRVKPLLDPSLMLQHEQEDD